MKCKILCSILFLFFFIYPLYGNIPGFKSIKIFSSNSILKAASVSTSETVMLFDNDKYGKILIDGDGMTLYFFTKDKDTSDSDCNGQCVTNWPIFYADTLNIGTGLEEEDFETIMRSDGKQQITYKGWPLYYFVGDNAAGDVNGDDVGGVWFVAKPNYTIMLINNQLVGNDGLEYNSHYQQGQEDVQYFVDKYGHTLYIFTHDTYNKNNYTNSDLSNNGFWPIFEDSLQSVPSNLDSKMFKMINVFGHNQLTYKGWPLYYFGPDGMIRGNNRGVSVPTPGVWPVAQASVSAAPEKVMLADSKYGSILTDGAGNTLYFFTKDKDAATSDCNGGCVTAWPIFYSDSLIIGAGLESDDFGTIMRDDTLPQTTYKGWPLYYYFGDNAPGDVNGENVGGVWFVAKPNYTLMLMNNQLVGKDGTEYNSHYQQGQEVVQYFVDEYGNTLYIFTPDTYNKNNYTKSDFSNNATWPIFEDSLQAVPSILDTNNFATIDVFGHRQLTYKGWPLYYFGPDSMKRGSTKGVSVPSPGVWPVAQATIDSATITGVENDKAISGLPRSYSLSQNYPNPFNPTTSIKFSIVNSEKVTLKIYNSLGQEVAVLLNKVLPAGNFNFTWNAASVPSGVYFYSITTNHFRSTKKMILLK